MADLFYVFLAITILFFIFLIIKQFLSEERRKKFCVLCAGVFFTWATLLVLYWLDLFSNLLIVALLIGSSVLGIFYTAERKMGEEIRIFGLPFFLTLIFIAYILLKGIYQIREVLVFLGILWILFYFIYLLRTKKAMKTFFKKIIECCKKW